MFPDEYGGEALADIGQPETVPDSPDSPDGYEWEGKTFKDFALSDIPAAFFNPDEFGEKHTVDGREMLCIVDADLVRKRARGSFEGWVADDTDRVSLDSMTLYVSRQAMGRQPTRGRKLKLDGREYRIEDSQFEGGVYVITLGRFQT